MKLLLFVSGILIGFAAAGRPMLDKEWDSFKKTYNKAYESQDEDFRRKAWEKNYISIMRHNMDTNLLFGSRHFQLGENEYMDMPIEEFTEVMNGFKKPRNTTLSRPLDYIGYLMTDLPKSVDWRTKGYVTPIKNQGQCGSCWAFSSTGSLEGQHFKATGSLVSLSEQNLVDCSGAEGNEGCNGGWMDQAFDYIKINHGIDTEESYPYTAKDGNCKFSKSSIGATDLGFVDVPHGSESALEMAVAAHGPISVAIDASHVSFQLYRSGVYDEPDCQSGRGNLDHGVLVVGYGSLEGQDYWIVKNSWGESWGDKGYIMMSRNKNNQCGIATQASYPQV